MCKCIYMMQTHVVQGSTLSPNLDDKGALIQHPTYVAANECFLSPGEERKGLVVLAVCLWSHANKSKCLEMLKVMFKAATSW